MIRIEGAMEDGKKVWIETNDTLVARDFIDRLESFEYKQATRSAMGVEMPKAVGREEDLMAMNSQGEIGRIKKDAKATIRRISNDGIPEDNYLGGVNYIHVKMPRASSMSGR